MQKIIVASLCLSCIVIQSCDNKNGNCTDPCTEIFATITVSVKDTAGAAVALDSFQVYAPEIDEDLTRKLEDYELETARKDGIYPLFDDLQVSRFQNDSLKVVFKGFLDGKDAIKAPYDVGADCCHVRLFSGDTDIVLGQE